MRCMIITVAIMLTCNFPCSFPADSPFLDLGCRFEVQGPKLKGHGYVHRDHVLDLAVS